VTIFVLIIVGCAACCVRTIQGPLFGQIFPAMGKIIRQAGPFDSDPKHYYNSATVAPKDSMLILSRRVGETFVYAN
jgi:hypothetical protein